MQFTKTRPMASSSQETVLLLLDDKVVGMGSIFSTSRDDFCHGEVVGLGCLIVGLIEVFSVISNLPFPSMGTSILMETRGSNVLWANEIKRICPMPVAEFSTQQSTQAQISPAQYSYRTKDPMKFQLI